MATNNDTPNDTKRPCYEVRLNAIRVSVWKNQGESGNWFNTVVTRRYRDGEEWRETNTLNGLADLALAYEGLRLARDFIADAERAMQTGQAAA